MALRFYFLITRLMKQQKKKTDSMEEKPPNVLNGF